MLTKPSMVPWSTDSPVSRNCFSISDRSSSPVVRINGIPSSCKSAPAHIAYFAWTMERGAVAVAGASDPEPYWGADW